MSSTHTVTMTTTRVTTDNSTATSNEHRLYLNTGLFRTMHGYIKILCIVLCLLAFICVMAVPYPVNSNSEAKFISFVTVTGMIVSALLLFLYFINAVVFAPIIPWLLVELVYSALWCFFCFVAGIVAAVFASKHAGAYVLPSGRSISDGFAASAFFLFLAMCVYGFYAFKLFMLHRQGVRLVVIVTENHVVTSSTRA